MKGMVESVPQSARAPVALSGCISPMYPRMSMATVARIRSVIELRALLASSRALVTM
jgi:hypothetical protein